jgi:hypothetical protein
MDSNTIVTVLTGLGGIVGGFFGGKRLAVSTAVDVVDLLQAAVEQLQVDKEHKDTEIAELKARIQVLEELVTQKADVAAVRVEVEGVREVVDRIADKVGA